MKRTNSTQLGGLDPILMTAKTRLCGVGEGSVDVGGRTDSSFLRQELKEEDGVWGGGGGRG